MALIEMERRKQKIGTGGGAEENGRRWRCFILNIVTTVTVTTSFNRFFLQKSTKSTKQTQTNTLKVKNSLQLNENRFGIVVKSFSVTSESAIACRYIQFI